MVKQQRRKHKPCLHFKQVKRPPQRPATAASQICCNALLRSDIGLLRGCDDTESVRSWEQFRTGAPLPHFSFHPNQPVDQEQPEFDTVTEEVVSSLCPYLSHTRSAHAQSYSATAAFFISHLSGQPKWKPAHSLFSWG